MTDAEKACNKVTETEHGVYDTWQVRFYWLTFFLIVLRLFLSVYLDLTPDETYYWELSRRLDLSYYDHPPMVAWLIAAFSTLFGKSQLSIRILSVAGSAIVGVCIFIIGRDWLKSSKTGFWAAFMVNFTPAGAALGFVTTPDTPLAIAWAFAVFAFLKALNSKRDFWWVITGLTLGFGALSKYNMIMFVPGVAVAILAFRRYQPLVVTRRYWLMVVLAAAGTLPVLYWNVQNDWISFRFQFDHGLAANNRTFLHNLGEYLGGQLGTLGLTLFPVLWLVVFKNAFRSFRDNDETRLFLAWLALPTMLFFTYTGIGAKVEANWPQVAYLSAILLAAEWIVSAENVNSRLWWVVGPSTLVAAIAIFQSLTLALPIPTRSDVTQRMHGWRQMGEIVRRIDKETDRKCVFIMQGATLATLVGYYGDIEPERTAELYASGNFRIWWRDRRLEAGTDVVFVDTDRDSEAAHYARKFAGAASESFDIASCGKWVRKINITRMYNLKEPFIFKNPKVYK